MMKKIILQKANDFCMIRSMMNSPAEKNKVDAIIGNWLDSIHESLWPSFSHEIWDYYSC